MSETLSQRAGEWVTSFLNNHHDFSGKQFSLISQLEYLKGEELRIKSEVAAGGHASMIMNVF